MALWSAICLSDFDLYVEFLLFGHKGVSCHRDALQRES